MKALHLRISANASSDFDILPALSNRCAAKTAMRLIANARAIMLSTVLCAGGCVASAADEKPLSIVAVTHTIEQMRPDFVEAYLAMSQGYRDRMLMQLADHRSTQQALPAPRPQK